MTWLDPMTLGAAAALVVTVCGVLYLLDTLHRRGNAAARLWAVAFVAGILSQASYLVSAAAPEAWVAVVVGNAALVVTMGMLWLGCMRFNGRVNRLAVWVMGCAVGLTVLAALVSGPDAGGWAGPWAMVVAVAVAVLAALGCWETRRGRIAGTDAALWLTVVLGVISVFYAARLVVLLVVGSESPVFVKWFGTPSASVVTIVLTVTAVVALTTLRVQVQEEREEAPGAPLVLSEQGYLDLPSFVRVLTAVIERARDAGEPTAVVVVRLDGLKEIAAVFGSQQVHELTVRWRAITRRSMPLAAFLAEDEGRAIVVGLPSFSDGESLNLANRVSSQLAAELTETEVEIVPIIGVGVATGVAQRGAAELLAAAQAAAEVSVRNLDGGAVLDAAHAPPREDGQAVRR